MNKITEILRNHATEIDGSLFIHENNFPSVEAHIMALSSKAGKTQAQKDAEDEYLRMYNRIRKHFVEKTYRKFVPTRNVAKPAQLHARLKDYTMDELGKVMYNAFKDNYHVDTKWKYVSTEYLTRLQTIEKYISA